MTSGNNSYMTDKKKLTLMVTFLSLAPTTFNIVHHHKQLT